MKQGHLGYAICQPRNPEHSTPTLHPQLHGEKRTGSWLTSEPLLKVYTCRLLVSTKTQKIKVRRASQKKAKRIVGNPASFSFCSHSSFLTSLSAWQRSIISCDPQAQLPVYLADVPPLILKSLLGITVPPPPPPPSIIPTKVCYYTVEHPKVYPQDLGCMPASVVISALQVGLSESL